MSGCFSKFSNGHLIYNIYYDVVTYIRSYNVESTVERVNDVTFKNWILLETLYYRLFLFERNLNFHKNDLWVTLLGHVVCLFTKFDQNPSRVKIKIASLGLSADDYYNLVGSLLNCKQRKFRSVRENGKRNAVGRTRCETDRMGWRNGNTVLVGHELVEWLLGRQRTLQNPPRHERVRHR